MKNSLTILLIFINFSAFAQKIYTLSGTVSSDTEKSVPYASIAVMKDSSMIKGLLSSEIGKYTIKLNEGKYLIKVSFIGYKSYAKSIDIHDDLELNIVLNKELVALSEVKVISNKPLVEQQIDRLVFNVENSIFSKGINALELLNQTPRVEVSPDGAIKLIGKNNLSVMIDGRIVQGDALKQRLSALRSDNISKIEVITTPPSKYSAEGNSGIINIILKKDPLIGWLFNFSTSYRQRRFGAVDQSININYKSKKLDLNIGIAGFIDSKRYESANKYQSTDFLWDKSNIRNATANNLSLNSSINYKLTKRMNLGVIADLSLEKAKEFGNTNSFFENPNNVIDSTINSPANIRNKYNFTSLSAYYDYAIDSAGKKLTVSGNYFSKNTDNNRSISSIINSNNSRIENITNGGDATYKGQSINIDLELPYKFAKIETGGALSFINNSSINNSSFNSISNGVDHFNYKERTAAAYLSASKYFSKKWSGKLGVRYENIYLDGNSIILHQQNTAQYNKLFPTAFLAFKPNENNTISIAYSKRIEKPIFYYLNPYRIYVDNYSYTSGNPYLLPSFSNNLEISETYKNNLTTTLSTSILSNGIDYVTNFSSNNSQTISIPENYIKQYNYNLDVSYTLPLNWVNSYNSLNLSYVRSTSNKAIVNIPDLKGFGAYYSIRNSFSLNEKRSTFLVLNYQQRFPTTTGFYKFESRSSFDLGLKFRAINRKLQANILLADLFKNNDTNGIRQYTAVKQTIRSYNDLRMLSISLSYSFGNKKAAVNTKPVNKSDQNRAIL